MALPGNHTNYTVTRGITNYNVTSSQGKVVSVPINIQRLTFDDGAIALDFDGNAGQVYRLYQAAFNRKPDIVGLSYWINVMDNGVRLNVVAGAFYNSAEFKSIYGATPSNHDLVVQFYRNALRREPDPAGLSYWVGLLDGGVLTPVQVLIQFSESPENKARVISEIQNGIFYVPPEMSQPAPSTDAFSATVTMAPASGAVLSRTVRLEVRGNAIGNVELLPASGYTPRLGVFNISPDRTFAYLDLDTTTLPNGIQDVRISAFSEPAGQPNATEVIAMPARRWEIRNETTPPAASFTATLSTAPPDGAILSGTARLEVRGSAIGSVKLLPASGYTPRLGVFSISVDRTFAWLDFDTRGLPNGNLDVRISAFNVGAGQPNAVEAIAMPPRRWELRN